MSPNITKPSSTGVIVPGSGVATSKEVPTNCPSPNEAPNESDNVTFVKSNAVVPVAKVSKVIVANVNVSGCDESRVFGSSKDISEISSGNADPQPKVVPAQEILGNANAN